MQYNKEYFCLHHPRLGELSLRPMDVDSDVKIFYPWVQKDYASFWGLIGKPIEEVASFYKSLVNSDHTKPYIGFHKNKPAFILECYSPESDAVGKHYEVLEGDLGMHILIAPPEKAPQKDFTLAVFHCIMSFIFEHENAKRIVVEPDVRNHKIHKLNRKVGFQHLKQISIGPKQAYLGFCERTAFQQAYQAYSKQLSSDSFKPGELAFASREIWSLVNRKLIRKFLTEFSHELIIQPKLESTEDGIGTYRIDIPMKSESTQQHGFYRFKAKILELDHWDIALDSIHRFENRKSTDLDAVRWIVEFQETLGLSKSILPVYLEEISSTLLSSYYKHCHKHLDSDDLIKADFQTLEHHMMEGHPSFAANNGRIGFSQSDYLKYAPETACPINVVWLAGHNEFTSFAHSRATDYAQLLNDEFDLTLLAEFRFKMKSIRLDLNDYTLIPVHPWQWEEKIRTVFASDIAQNRLVYLGESQDLYAAQQSIRTLFNTSQQRRHYMKFALSILNMGFVRGLSAEYMAVTPAINDWVYDIVTNDSYLQDREFCPLREIASVGFKSPYLFGNIDKTGIHNKMLAALWRESPVAKSSPHAQLMTMAALLYEGPEGDTLLPKLIETSNASPKRWLESYMTAFLQPILHCFYQHSLVFMPHGENIILSCEDGLVERVFLKEIGEEVCLFDPTVMVPDSVARIKGTFDDDVIILWILADLFAGFFRYMAQILDKNEIIARDEFWQTVAESVHDYQSEHPHLEHKFKRFDLFTKSFRRQCLNRLQLKNNQQMVQLDDIAGSLEFQGTLKNPIAKFRNIDTKANKEILSTGLKRQIETNNFMI